MQTLLRLREAARDERRLQLAQAQQAEQVLRDQIARLDDESHDLERSVRQGSQPGAIDVDRLLTTSRYQLVLAAQRQQLERQKQRVSEEIQRRCEALLEADREVRVLEKLREKQQQAHVRAESLREIKQIDETAQRVAKR